MKTLHSRFLNFDHREARCTINNRKSYFKICSDSDLVDTVLVDTVLKQGVPMVHKVEAGHTEVEHWDPLDKEVPHYLGILVE